MTEAEREKQPLLENTNRDQNNSVPEPETKRVPRRCFLVAPVVLLHLFSYALINITMTQYAYAAIYEMRYPNETTTGSSEGDASCEVNTTSDTYIHQQTVQAETSLWTIYCYLAANSPAILANLLMGPLSDKYGRKNVFIISLLGTFARSLGNAFAIYYKINIYIFVAFYGVEGICGLWMCTLNTSHSYVADITGTGKQRSFGMALIEICLGLGLTLGTLASGYIIADLGFMYPMVVSFSCIIIAIIIAAFILPETSIKINHQPQSISQTFRNTISFYTDKSANRWRYVVCLSIIFLVAFSNIGRTSVDTLYELNSPFCWDSVLIGWYATLRSLCHIIIGIGSVRLFQFCLSDESIAMLGSISFVGSAIQEALAETDIILFTVPLTGAGSIMSAPMIRGIMSRMTRSDKQGAMFAGIAAVEAVCGLTGAISANALYAATVNFFRGLVFLVLGGYNFIVLILLLVLKLGGKSGVYSNTTVEITVSRKPSNKTSSIHESSMNGHSISTPFDPEASAEKNRT